MPAQQPGVMQRRHSSASSSDAASDQGMNSRQTSQENISLIPTRTAKVTTSKPAANPLQFIKVGPCDLYRTAQEQLKKVEEVKKVKQERRDEAEDWQSNLDNWKCSRRKRQEHIIERVVEVKKFELEEFDRNRRRSKTFNEMLEERNSKGRKMSLPVYKDDDNDLSELGLGSSKNGTQTNEEDSVFSDVSKDNASEASKIQETSGSAKQNGLGLNGHSAEDKNNSNDTEEYTYERAIQSYVNFTESRVRGRSLTTLSEEAKSCNGFSKKPSPPVPAKPRRNSCKIEEKLSEFQEIKKKSVSTTDLSSDVSRRSVSVPKVDISKRRELFEKSVEEEQNAKINRLSGDFSSSKSIRERLSSLGKLSDEISSGSTKKLNGLSSEVSVKDRLSNIEKNKLLDTSNTLKVNRVTNEAGQQSVRDRLSSLQKEVPVEKDARHRLPSEITSIKARLTSLDAACHKEVPRSVPEQEVIVSKKDEFQDQEKNFKDENFERAFSPEEDIYENKRQQHFRHRSLDSLDIESTDGLGNESFERVQSLEDLDFCRNYPASSLSGDTDREDSGINTADVSSSVSQADDCDLHLDDDIKLHHQPPIMEELPKLAIQEKIKESNSLVESEPQIKQISVSSLSVVEELIDCKTETMVVEPSSSFLKLPLRLELDPLPVILESPSEPNPAFDIIDKFKEEIQKEESVCDDSVQNSNMTQLVPSESNLCSDNEAVEYKINENTDESSTGDFNISKANPDHSRNNIENSNTSNTVLSPSNTEDSNLPNALPDSCPNKTVNISESCNEDSASGSPLSVSNVSMDVTAVCMQDETACSGAGDNKRKTVVEICHKIDSKELTSPLPTPFISVDTNFIFNAQEKFEESPDMSNALQETSTKVKEVTKDIALVEEKPSTQFKALTVEVARKEDNVLQTAAETTQQSESLLTIHNVEVMSVDKNIVSTVTETSPLYLNSEFNLSGDVVFPLSPTTLEPPKEKPPPPPTETSDDDDGSLTEKSSPLRRLDSTKRIKKEIRQKRSSFLGLNDGLDDDSYLEPELEVRPPPDMTTFLAEERRLEQMMYRQSICSESDSNQESRDSGVELEKHPDDLTWSRLHHSRDNSETFGNTSTTSEEEEIIKKEREIIEILEQEELNRYQNTSQNDQDNIGEKLALRLRELEQEKSHLEWERREEAIRRKAEENARAEHESRIQVREQELRKQENIVDSTVLDEETANQHQNMEILISEREHLEKEQEALLRQRESIMQQQWSSSMQDISVTQQSVSSQVVEFAVPVPNYRHSLTNANAHAKVDYRQSMPDLATTQPRRPPPPIPPSKPLIVPRNQEKRTSSPQQMSRQTIQALSAAPRSRLISNDNWMQTKRKQKVAQDNNYNYQHWLIQEAEHRRITEQHQRQAPPVRRPAPSQSHSQNGQWPQNGTPQYTNWQPPQQKVTQWTSPPQEQQNSQWQSTPQHQQNSQRTNQQPQRPSPPQQQQWASPQHHPTVQPRSEKPLPDSIIQTLTQRVQNRINSSDTNNNRKRVEPSPVVESRPQPGSENQEKMLSVSGKKKCSHCGEELGRGAAMIIESLRLFYHINCFKCCVCCIQLGDGLMGTDVRVRNNKLHCHNCYSSDDGVKFSCV